MRKPPFGMMARLSGASVCRPTTTSFSRSMYPGPWAVIELGTCETSRTPFFRSSTNSASSFAQIAFVRAVAGARKAPSPSYGS